ncbi:hypothetical protein PG996_014225 [Apiospora saccharicola]|uniref:Uncharacterized protein n=1 Tax=Apiospora saccharicola TaxID=335842 RepID=A0ABR1TJP6_9PEZI
MTRAESNGLVMVSYIGGVFVFFLLEAAKNLSPPSIKRLARDFIGVISMTAGTRVFVVFTAICGDHWAPPLLRTPFRSMREWIRTGRAILNIAAVRLFDMDLTALTETYDSDGSIIVRSSDLWSLMSGPVFHFDGVRDGCHGCNVDRLVKPTAAPTAQAKQP